MEALKGLVEAVVGPAQSGEVARLRVFKGVARESMAVVEAGADGFDEGGEGVDQSGGQLVERGLKFGELPFQAVEEGGEEGGFSQLARDGGPCPSFRPAPFSIISRKAFRDINLEWVQEMFVVEAADREVLDYPQEHILDDGGVIVLALVDGVPMGTGALKKTAPGEYELTKMGVLKASRGLGLGKLVLDKLIERARELGARRLYLLTNTDCDTAIKLYEKRGFVHDAAVLQEFGGRYKRADVGMLFPLSSLPL